MGSGKGCQFKISAPVHYRFSQLQHHRQREARCWLQACFRATKPPAEPRRGITKMAQIEIAPNDYQRFQNKITKMQNLQEYQNFLERHLDKIEVLSQIQAMREAGLYRFPINLDYFRKEAKAADLPNLVDDLIRSPTDLIKTLETKLQSICSQLANDQDDAAKKGGQLDRNYKIYFEGKLGRNFVTPRGLGAAQVNQLVSIQGIVTKMSGKQLKLLESTQFIEAKNKFKVTEYFNNLDASEATRARQVRTLQKKDEEGNPMIMEHGLSHFRDFQTLVVQEVPERTPTGFLPRSVEVMLSQDLVDKAKPGDRVTIQGVFRCCPNSTTLHNGTMRTYLIALDLKSMQSDQETKIVEADITHIRNISKTPKLLEYMARSIAPSIYGHEIIKQAILLQLLGGKEKNLETGTHLRGDINILLIGDPSTAKSQLLRYVMGTAPLAINTTGRGTSSVGLTAAVKKDHETGETSLEAGAMVLADGGMILIDEFDKMNESDRVAIHEVMEQQTVTIAKAGIHCSLNARCSVLAASNPIYGEYQLDLPPTKNIGLPDSLLSRFDLLFIVLDEKKREIDLKVAERVTKNHRFKGATEEEQNIGDIIQPMAHLNIKQESTPYIQQSNIYHTRDQKDMLNQNFLKKYIQYAKEHCQDVDLDDEAAQEVKDAWVRMRERDQTEKQIRTQPITIRSLESLIRLATAHAKLRLSQRVTAMDVKQAVKLMKYSLAMEDELDEIEPVQQKPKSRPSRGSVQKQEQTPMKQEQLKQEQEGDDNQIVVRSEKKKQLKDQQLEKDAEFMIELSKANAQYTTKDQQRTVFRLLTELKLKTHRDEHDIDLVWGKLQEQPRPLITEYSVLLKCILDLKDKVHMDIQKKTVQLL